ncbi:hypothetical protein THAOC_27758 [Thalassiosira oceanica]|uniref:Uncharacterized protein n=1 Tax=Thalassiosira oceanica TaxID=159749 RepID=K0RI41_THAOC|nr:hypothetical protein THAOC_27758 [Thalassiosira oceanica]|eukprot:EJK52915.1 hypothetical protein THAOC_27758 [Thalassiosira oceanica]
MAPASDDCDNSLTPVSASTSWFGPVKSRLNPRTGVIPSRRTEQRLFWTMKVPPAAAEVNDMEPALEATSRTAHLPLTQLPLVWFCSSLRSFLAKCSAYERDLSADQSKPHRYLLPYLDITMKELKEGF